MQKKLANILFSTRLTGILFIVYAAAMNCRHIHGCWSGDITNTILKTLHL